MGWLTIAWFLTVGYLPQNQLFMQQVAPIVAQCDNSGCFEQTLGFSATAWRLFKLWTTIETFDEMGSMTSFYPFRSNFALGLEFIMPNFTAGIKHECDHPTIWNWSKQPLGYGENVTELYLTIHGEGKL